MTSIDVYDSSITDLERLFTADIIPASRVGLRRVELLLERLGNPHRSFHSVHVAGSTGKGSTTTLVGAILRTAGFRTGLFRSPHLVDYTERIAVDGTHISRDEWIWAFNHVWPVAVSMWEGRIPGYDLGRPSFFEVIFAMMAVHFRRTGVEWAAIETGMGGRLDATNTLLSDVAVVTNVSLEHTEILGRSVRQIAGEKAAIIKAGGAAVTAAQDPDALGVIEARAALVDVPLWRVGHEIQAVPIQTTAAHGAFQFTSPANAVTLSLPMCVPFQVDNAAAAFGAASQLQQRGLRISDEDMLAGLQAPRIPGRFEIVDRSPLTILDGAHSPAACHALRLALDAFVPGRRVVLVFAVLSDKDIPAMVGALADKCKAVFTTRAIGTPRATSPASLAEHFLQEGVPTQSVDDPLEAIDQARRQTDPADVLVVAGSLYLVGWARNLWPKGTTAV